MMTSVQETATPLSLLGRYAKIDRTRAAEVKFDRESLYAEFRPLVRRLVRQYGDTPELRQELTGEIYWRFCALLDAYDPGRGIPLRPYLVRQLTASIYSYARTGWNLRKREVSLETGIARFERDLTDDSCREWDDKLVIDQTAKALPAAISRLSPRQRKVVIWRYMEQRSFAEIAGLLNVQESTARSLLRHGLMTLRKQILGPNRRIAA